MDEMFTIGLLLASLIAGAMAGSLRGELSPKARKHVSMAMTGLVFVLILTMGLKTGSNEAVVSNLGAYGLQSLLIAAAAIVGSTAFALLFEKLLFKDGIK